MPLALSKQFQKKERIVYTCMIVSDLVSMLVKIGITVDTLLSPQDLIDDLP